jgi:bud site selection protein 20
MGKTKKCNRNSKSHNHKKISHLHKIYKTKRRTRDHDQIHEDLKIDTAIKLINQNVDHDEAGSAQYYCIHCA